MLHAQHACLVLDFYEFDCDWFQKSDVMEIVCGVVFADVTFRAERSDNRKHVCERRLTHLEPFVRLPS